MAQFNVILPAMGEGVIEATITKWLVSEGAAVMEGDPLVEVATDKVDSEVPSPAEGKIVSIIAREGSVVKVGQVLAVIESRMEAAPDAEAKIEKEVERIRETITEARNEKKETEEVSRSLKSRTHSGKFLSPLVRSIAAREGISYAELDTVTGTGMDGRVTRDDILKMLDTRNKAKQAAVTSPTYPTPTTQICFIYPPDVFPNL